MNPIQVILVDDHEMVRQGLAQVLEDSPDIKVVGQGSRGEEALGLVKRSLQNGSAAEVLVLDYGLPDLDGAAVAARIRKDHPQVKVVILTVHDNVHYVLKALEAGAAGFVVKSDAVSELVRAIRQVHEGSEYVSPRLAEQVNQHRRGHRGRHVGLAKLSQREFELLRRLGVGVSLQECAAQMGISESTASTYRSRMMTKLELTSTAQIIRFAVEHGISA
ncbi:MAG: response regulator [Planctomycetota bacterium]